MVGVFPTPRSQYRTYFKHVAWCRISLFCWLITIWHHVHLLYLIFWGTEECMGCCWRDQPLPSVSHQLSIFTGRAAQNCGWIWFRWHSYLDREAQSHQSKVCRGRPKKFLCGHKHKFGLNCQTVSDCCGRILDISNKCESTSSDCLAFEPSELHRCLENGLLQHDDGNVRLVLFGDNTYLNTPYMATPFTNVSGTANWAAEDS